MKAITPALVKFAITATLLAIIFRYALTHGIEMHSNLVITLAAASYAILMFLSGWRFGKKEGDYLPIYDVGFRFHLATYVIHNGISEGWFAFGFNARSENISVIHYTAIIWGVFLVCHFIFFLRTRKHAINYLGKEDLFD